MCSFLITNKSVTDEELLEANKFAQRRGPDGTKTVQVDGITAVHNLLSITGEAEQPVHKDNLLYVFNGEIYNYKDFGDYDSDTDCIADLYKSHGPQFAREIDGEFAICLYDIDTKELIIASDPFRTKPLYYAFNGEHDFGVATYRSSLLALGFINVYEFPANTIVRACKRGYNKTWVHKFDIKQYKDTFDDWVTAFQNAVRKRTCDTEEKVFTGLSSGHDSGAIFLEMCNQNVDFMSYSILNNEYKAIIEKRLKRHSQNLTYKFGGVDTSLAAGVIASRVEDYKSDAYDIKKDYASLGLSSICRKALSGIPHKIYISGCGADEIMSDYAYKGEPVFKSNSCFNGVFPEDLSDIFPWKNFYGGTMKNYLMKEEHVCGAHGIEARYPFLDTKVVQEFLNLKHTLKNSNYKAPLKYYFNQYDYPYHEFKLGFSPFEPTK